MQHSHATEGQGALPWGNRNGQVDSVEKALPPSSREFYHFRITNVWGIKIPPWTMTQLHKGYREPAMLDFVRTLTAHTTEFNLLNNYTLEQNKPWFIETLKRYKSVFKKVRTAAVAQSRAIHDGGVLQGCEPGLSPGGTTRPELTPQPVCVLIPCAFPSHVSPHTVAALPHWTCMFILCCFLKYTNQPELNSLY